MRFGLTCLLLLLLGFRAVSQPAYTPAGRSLELFRQYQPVIEKTNEAIVQEPLAVTGDINGDSLEDCIVFFVLTPRTGGNIVVDRQAAVYLNTGSTMKVAGAFPDLHYCYVVDRIAGQLIYIKEYRCRPPYDEYVAEHRLAWRKGKIRLL